VVEVPARQPDLLRWLRCEERQPDLLRWLRCEERQRRASKPGETKGI
jgi:hypothetical protein